MITYGGHYLESDDLKSLGIKAVGNDVRVHSTCVLVGLENMTFGSHVRVDAYSALIAGSGSIDVGSHVHIAAYVFLSGAGGVSVGDFVGLSQRTCIYSRNDDYSGRGLTGPTIPMEYLRLTEAPVAFGRHVVLGAGSIVLPGVSVGEGSTIGAMSLVKNDLEPWGIYAGVPVRRLRERNRDLLALEALLLAQEEGESANTNLAGGIK